jgi:hypothetical protein
MKRNNGTRATLLIGAWIVVTGIGAGSPAVAQRYSETEIDISVFYDELAPYGDWVSVPQYGWVWTPGDVPPGWRPYTTGQWTYSDDDGWLWVDEAEWGWAPFHYGRWYFDDTFGWAWVPDTEWAPAWVAWRTDEEYVGWAPLPPQARWQAEIGLDLGGIDIDIAINPSSWCFVAEREIFEPRIYTRAVLPARNVSLLRTTRYETRYTLRERRIVNAGISIERDERRLASERSIRSRRCADRRGSSGTKFPFFDPAWSVAIP